MTHAQSKAVLLLASVYNVLGGLTIIFLLEVLAPFIGFEPRGNMLFRLFAGGTAITFGIAYFQLAYSGTFRTPILFFGNGLKYWAFIAALWCYLFFDLSISVLLGFGVGNLCFALLFTRILLGRAE